jgi:hypothetical protein
MTRLRIILKIVLAGLLIILLLGFARTGVDFVYTGF